MIEKGPSQPVRVIIVDDHPIVRYGIVQVLTDAVRYEVVGEAGEESEAIRLVRNIAPEMVIIDLFLKGTNGIELLKILKSIHPELLAIMLSVQPKGLYALRAIKAGASGYVLKQETATRLVEALDSVLEGHFFLSRAIQDQFIEMLLRAEQHAPKSGIDALTDRELEVFNLLGQGHGRSIIADIMKISPKTVETYRDNIKRKLELPSNQALVKQAIEWQGSMG